MPFPSTPPETSASGRLHAAQSVWEHPSAFAKIAALFPDGETLAVFDAGCGDARLSTELVRRGHVVVGVDAHPAAVAAARAAGVAAVLGDLEARWPAADNSADVVLLVDVMEHVVNPLFVLSEARRLLKDGGACIVTWTNHFDIRGRVEFLLGRGIVHWSHRRYGARAADYSHLRFLRRPELFALVAEAGFAVALEQRNFMGGGLLPRRLLPPFVRRALLRGFPDLLSGKFMLRLSAPAPGTDPGAAGRPKLILLDRTPSGL